MKGVETKGFLQPVSPTPKAPSILNLKEWFARVAEDEPIKKGRWDFANIESATLGRYRTAVRQREFAIRKQSYTLFQKKRAASQLGLGKERRRRGLKQSLSRSQKQRTPLLPRKRIQKGTLSGGAFVIAAAEVKRRSPRMARSCGSWQIAG